jgi:hypothetical protein
VKKLITDVACPYCKSPAGKNCRVRDGVSKGTTLSKTMSHSERWAAFHYKRKGVTPPAKSGSAQDLRKWALERATANGYNDEGAVMLARKYEAYVLNG